MDSTKINNRQDKQAEPQQANPELEVIELIKFVSGNKLDKDPRIKALLTSLTHNPEDKERKAQLMRMIKPTLIHNLLTDDPFRPHPQDDEVTGEIKLGVCAETSAVFGLNLEELMQGTLIVGRPGSGKTTLTYNIIERANELGICCLILDIKKDYRHIIRKLHNTLVFRADSEAFKWNPLQQPEGVDRISHITNFANITSEAYAVYDGTNNYLVEHLSRLYEKLEHPTLIDLYNAIKNEKQALVTRTARYKESALNRLASIMVKMGKAFLHRKGYRLEEMLDDYNIVIELDNLGSKGCIYLSSLILSHVFQYRIANNLRGLKQKPVLVIMDEGNEIFDRNLERQLGGLTLTTMAREAREFQLGLVVSCQIPDVISDSVKNVYTRVLMSLPEGINLGNFAKSMGLTKEQQECNYSLLPGQAITRLAGRYDKPFVVQFLPYDIEKNVNNEEVASHMKPLLAEFDERYDFKQEEQAIETGLQKQEEPLPEEKVFLADIYNHPYLSIAERCKERRFSGFKSQKLQNKLTKLKLCEILKINLGMKGKVPGFFVLTDEGFKTIGIPKKYKIDKSNFEHSFWEDRIARHFEKECKTAIEKEIKGKEIDVAIENEGKLIAIEVAITSAYEKQNIIKDLDAGCVKVIIACRNKKVLEEVKNIVAGLDSEMQGKVKIYLLTEITKLSLEELI